MCILVYASEPFLTLSIHFVRRRWKRIHTSIGFEDMLLMEMEQGDPTRDMMMCFMKPGNLAPQNLETSCPREAVAVEPPVAELVRALLGQVPKAHFGVLEIIIKKFDVSSLRDSLLSIVKSRGLPPTITEWIEGVSNMFIEGSKIAKEILEKAQIKDHFDSEWLCAEMWLVLPCLQRRVAAGKAGETEIKVVNFISSTFPALLLGSDHDSGEDEPTKKEGEDVGAEQEGEKVSGEEVLAALKALEIPNLFSPSALAKSGFSVRQQAALVSQFGGKDASEASYNFSSYLTRKSWNEIKDELKFCTELPTKKNIIDSDGHPWNSVMRAFMRSPRVKLRTKTRYLMKMGGLKRLDEIYEEEKTGKGRSRTKSSVTRIPASDVVKSLITKCEEAKVVTRVFEGGVWVSGVAKIHQAQFGYKR